MRRSTSREESGRESIGTAAVCAHDEGKHSDPRRPGTMTTTLDVGVVGHAERPMWPLTPGVPQRDVSREDAPAQNRTGT